MRLKEQNQSRAALIAVLLFLIFDFAALALNFWLSSEIEKQAVGINLAGRQRMLSQRLPKVLLLMEDALQAGQDPTPQLNELKLTFDLFDNTLQGFSVGHLTQGGSGTALFLEPVSEVTARAVVTKAEALWAPYRVLVLDVIAAGRNGLNASLPPATAYSKQHNVELLTLMNQLTTELELLTERKAAQIRWYQGIAFVLALANFLGALYLYRHRFKSAIQQKNIFDEIISKIPAGVMVLGIDAKSILKANHSAEQLFGYGAGELVGKKLPALLSEVDGKLIAQRKDGSTFHASVEQNQADLYGRKVYIETVTDVTTQRQNEENLNALAYNDGLTGLPNRLLFDDRFAMEIAHASRRGTMLGVLFVDLDKFKPVNDSYGHRIGDILLQEVATRILSCLRQCDTASRHGGDEFTIIVSDITSKESCAKIAHLVISRLEEPFILNGQELFISASIGISIFPNDGTELSELLGHADQAMYSAKQKGGGKYAFYTDIRRGSNLRPALDMADQK